MIYVLEQKQVKIKYTINPEAYNYVSNYTPLYKPHFTIWKWGVRGCLFHGHVFMISLGSGSEL